MPSGSSLGGKGSSPTELDSRLAYDESEKNWLMQGADIRWNRNAALYVPRALVTCSATLSCTDPTLDLGSPNASQSAWDIHFSLQQPLRLVRTVRELLIP